MSDEYEIEVIPVVIAEEPIELYKILKIENLVTSGSEAKNLIAEGYVYVNGEVETRKRKKIMFGDIIGFDGEAYLILSADDMDEYAMAEIEAGAEVENMAEPETALQANTLSDANKAPAANKKQELNDKPQGTNKSKSKNQQSVGSKKKGRAAPFNF